MADIRVSGKLIRKYSSTKDGLVYRHLYIYEQKKHIRGVLYRSTTIGWKHKENIIDDVSVRSPFRGINEDEINFIFELMNINKDEYRAEKVEE